MKKNNQIIQELPSETKPDTSFNPEELEQQLSELNKAANDLDADLVVEKKDF